MMIQQNTVDTENPTLQDLIIACTEIVESSDDEPDSTKSNIEHQRQHAGTVSRKRIIPIRPLSNDDQRKRAREKKRVNDIENIIISKVNILNKEFRSFFKSPNGEISSEIKQNKNIFSKIDVCGLTKDAFNNMVGQFKIKRDKIEAIRTARNMPQLNYTKTITMEQLQCEYRKYVQDTWIIDAMEVQKNVEPVKKQAVEPQHDKSNTRPHPLSGRAAFIQDFQPYFTNNLDMLSNIGRTYNQEKLINKAIEIDEIRKKRNQLDLTFHTSVTMNQLMKQLNPPNAIQPRATKRKANCRNQKAKRRKKKSRKQHVLLANIQFVVRHHEIESSEINGIQRFRCLSEGCEKHFGTKQKVREHMQRVHLAVVYKANGKVHRPYWNENFKCLCGLQCRDRTDYRKHRERVHENNFDEDGIVICSGCDYTCNCKECWFKNIDENKTKECTCVA